METYYVVEVKGRYYEIEFSSLSEANRNGYHRSNIRKCANSKQPKHKGYKWFYKKNYTQGVG